MMFLIILTISHAVIIPMSIFKALGIIFMMFLHVHTAGLPLAPLMTSITLILNGANSSSILISWNSSDCAVQYVVTINSSDGSVYSNITTSDTNTTVTLPNGVEYCATVVAVDGIGRRGPDSTGLCYGNYALVGKATEHTQ